MTCAGARPAGATPAITIALLPIAHEHADAGTRRLSRPASGMLAIGDPAHYRSAIRLELFS